MSTLAAARADNFYYPKDWDPSKENLKEYKLKQKYKNNSKKLQEIEERKIKKQIKKDDKDALNRSIRIRFEVPFHIRCNGCDEMLAKGVRFNATKKHVGNYYSTKIFQFIMNCDICLQKIVCQTDPENCDYNFIEGANKWLDQSKAVNDVTFLREDKELFKIQTNPIYKLDVQKADIDKANLITPQIELIYQNNIQKQNDFDLNQIMRKKLKQENKEIQNLISKQNPNFNLKLGSYLDTDEKQAKSIFQNKNQTFQQQKNNFDIIKSQSIIKTKNSSQIDELYRKLNNLPQNTKIILQNQIKQNYSQNKKNKLKIY